MLNGRVSAALLQHVISQCFQGPKNEIRSTSAIENTSNARENVHRLSQQRIATSYNIYVYTGHNILATKQEHQNLMHLSLLWLVVLDTSYMPDLVSLLVCLVPKCSDDTTNIL